VKRRGEARIAKGETQKLKRKFLVSEVSNMHSLRRSLLPIAGFILMIVFKTDSQGLSPQQTAPQQEINALVSQEYSTLFQLYCHLHAHPELSFQEVKTAERIRKELESAGFGVTANFGGNGLVGVMENGQGPTVMIRTDLDALPVTEETGLEYVSRVRVNDDQGREVGVMHACGHDVHMACFVGTARLLSRLKGRWRGTLLMIGQPAEERGGGAKAMLDEGLYQKFPRPDYVLALHDDAGLETGRVGLCEGNALAGVDSVNLTIRGISGHGAYPFATKDPIVLSAQTIMALQTIVSREMRAIDPAVVTVGSIHGGTKHNIIPDEVQLQLTIRHYSDAIRAHILQSIDRIAKGIAQAGGVPKDREPIVKVLQAESIPPTFNNPELTRRIARAIEAVLGKDNVLAREPVMGGEDFGYFGRTEEKVPICIFWLGAVSPERIRESQKGDGKPLPSLHSSVFAPVPEPTIKTGVRAMTTAALELLGRK
jgi:amidohydrolase